MKFKLLAFVALFAGILPIEFSVGEGQVDSNNPTQQNAQPIKTHKQLEQELAVAKFYQDRARRDRIIQNEELPPLVHPLLWGVLTLLLLGGAVAWSSSEWEWHQLQEAVISKMQ